MRKATGNRAPRANKEGNVGSEQGCQGKISRWNLKGAPRLGRRGLR